MEEPQEPQEPQEPRRRRRERRRLWDRRAPELRRTGRDRRAGERPEVAEQWAERRKAERRATERRIVSTRRRGRRRRDSPTPYSAEEIAQLKARARVKGPIECPACGASFSLGPERKKPANGGTMRRVACLGCGRAAVIENPLVSRILLVDGNATLRDMLQSALTAAGHEVVETADAVVALHAYQTSPADVVLIDVLASGRIAAPDFIRRLRRVFPDARVIALAGRSSYREGDPLAVVQGLGAVRTLRMPLSREQVLAAIDEVRAGR